MLDLEHRTVRPGLAEQVTFHSDPNVISIAAPTVLGLTNHVLINCRGRSRMRRKHLFAVSG